MQAYENVVKSGIQELIGKRVQGAQKLRKT
jgi:hypothetical protein